MQTLSVLNRFVRVAVPALFLMISVKAKTINLSADSGFRNFSDAAGQAAPGDTILVHPGIYQGNQVIRNLQGTSDAWIYIIGADRENTVFQGGVGAWILEDPSYLEIRHLTFTRQTHNGLNIHDGDSYESPGHDLRIVECSFYDMSGNGNHDFLKLSGINRFEIISCTFVNGSMGSGIDMVGCHNGLIRGCTFRDLPGGGVQAKGGSANIRIESNRFTECGIRAVNAGGSTDLRYFRPRNASSQASHIDIVSNVFNGGTSAISFAGAIRCRAVNNTIVNPSKFVVRILQEQTEGGRFKLCGDNAFHNNLVYLDRVRWEEVNVGPDTRSESFSFGNNLWYTHEKPSRRPGLPVVARGEIHGRNPMLVDISAQDFRIADTSPAAGAGRPYPDVKFDIIGNSYSDPPSIGAYETAGISDTRTGTPSNSVFGSVLTSAEYYLGVLGSRCKKTLKFVASVVGLR